MKADAVIGLAYGDEAKSKVVHHLLKTKPYTHSIKINGGHNRGGTLYHNNKKYILHILPVGIFHNIPSIIGPNCVINPKLFEEEVNQLLPIIPNIKELIHIAPNAHVITNKHLEEDQLDTKIGTTKKGTGPAYRDKYDRKGTLAKDHPILKPYTKPLLPILTNPSTYLLAEGAQGHYLDPIHGDYPYTTSSHTTIAATTLSGIPPHTLNHIYGVAKAYDTYVGNKQFQPIDPTLNQFQILGKEFGATTNRKRQTNYLNLNNLKTSAYLNSITHLIINKMDILKQTNTYKLLNPNLNLKTEENFKKYLTQNLPYPITFSYSPKLL